MRISATCTFLTAFLGLALLAEPSLANRFETISGGVSGSVTLKHEFVQTVLLVAALVFLLGSGLAILLRNSNAALLNFRNWKTSSVVMAVLSALMLVFYLLV